MKEFAALNLTFSAWWEIQKFLFKLRFYESFSTLSEPQNTTSDLQEYLLEALRKQQKPTTKVEVELVRKEINRIGSLSEAYKQKNLTVIRKIYHMVKFVSNAFSELFRSLGRIGFLTVFVVILLEILALIFLLNYDSGYYLARLLAHLFPNTSSESNLIVIVVMIIFVIQILLLLLFSTIAVKKASKIVLMGGLAFSVTCLGIISIALATGGIFMQQDYVFYISGEQVNLDIDHAAWSYVNIETSDALPADQMGLHLDYTSKSTDSLRAPSISLTQEGDVQTLKIVNNSERGYDEPSSDYMALTIKLPQDRYLLTTSKTNQEHSIYDAVYLATGNIEFQYQSSDIYSINELYDSEKYFSFNSGQPYPETKCLDEFRELEYDKACEDGYLTFAEPADMEILKVEGLTMTLTDRNIVLKKK